MKVFDRHELIIGERNALDAEMTAMKAKSPLPLELPPKCFFDMEGQFLRYQSRKAILNSFPVLEKQLNPIGVMQGGYIAAAFDNTMGPLSYLAAQKTAVTLDMAQTYLRAIRLGETLFCEAEVIARGQKTIYMTANAWDSRGKHIASAQTQILIV